MDNASVLADRKTAYSLLEDAVKMNPYYLSAVVNLSKIYIEEGKADKALQL